MSDLNKRIEELEKKIDNKYDNGIYGALIDRYITCGKAGCKCRQGYKHGPYAHIQLYDKDNILRGIYIGNKKKELYLKRLEENKEYFKIIKELNSLYLLRKNQKQKG